MYKYNSENVKDDLEAVFWAVERRLRRTGDAEMHYRRRQRICDSVHVLRVSDIQAFSITGLVQFNLHRRTRNTSSL